MHFFSGVLVALAVIIVWNYFRNVLTVERRRVILVAIFFALVVGLLWEIFEVYSELTSFTDGIWYTLDTVKDLAMDMSGSFLGTLYGLNLMSKKI